MLVGVNVGHFPELPDMAEQLRLLWGWPVVRFLEWQRVNVTHANQVRPTLGDILSREPWAFVRGPWHLWPGVPVAKCCYAANAVQARGWHCAPHWLDDNELLAWAEFVIKRSSKPPILEWSNEVWNAGFRQQAEIGCDLRTALREQARRTSLLADATRGRADVVLSTQAANSWIAEYLLQQQPRMTALAIAPYWRTHEELERIPERLVTHRRYAERAGVALWCYECGPHDTTRAADGNAETEERCDDVRRYLDLLRHGGVALACWYNVASAHRPGHAWGLHIVDGPTARHSAVALVIENRHNTT